MTKIALKKHLTTWCVLLLAALAVWFIWQNYFNSLWTRDARVAARVVQMTADVPGRITQMPLSEGQKVSRGQLLFSVDTARYKLAVAAAKATLSRSSSQVALKSSEARRALRLKRNISREDLERKQSALAVAQATKSLAQAQLSSAKLDLKRTQVAAPFDASVTRLGAYAGDYATVGEPLVSLVKDNSFWIQAYFKETQVHRIHRGDRAIIHLLGYSKRLKGRVRNIGRGISNSNQLPGDQGLPSVSASFDWVRLAQRIPVEIEITSQPDGLLLSAGMTASVEIMPASD